MQVNHGRGQARFFLSKKVVGRAKRRGGCRSKDAPSEDEDGRPGPRTRTVVWRTPDEYVSATASLWDFQRRASFNSHSHPRSGKHGESLVTMKRWVAEKKRKDYHDR